MIKYVNLRDVRDIDLDDVTIKSVNGEDSLDAASRCFPPDGSQMDMNLFGMMMRQQTILQSIVSYTPRKGNSAGLDIRKIECAAPPVEIIRVSNRTREFLGEVYDYVNSMGMDERDSFRKALGTKQLVGSTPGSDETASAE